MAKYRPLRVKLWKNPKFEEYSPLKKLIYIYCTTNESVTESGIYPISLRTISRETGVQLKKVKAFLEEIEFFSYDSENQILFVRDFLKDNTYGGRPDLIEKSIMRDCDSIKSKFWEEFLEINPKYKRILEPIIKGSEEIDKPLEKGSKEIDKPLEKSSEIIPTNNNNNNKNNFNITNSETAVKTKEKSSPKVSRKESVSVFSKLISQGINEKKAKTLVANHSAEFLELKILQFEFVKDYKPRLVAKNPTGYLIKSIEKNYDSPAGFDRWYDEHKKSLRQSEIRQPDEDVRSFSDVLRILKKTEPETQDIR